MPKRTRSSKSRAESAPTAAAVEAATSADSDPLPPPLDASPPERSDRFRAVGLAVLVVALLLLMRPLIDVPRNDDFSYARTAEAFAQTGRVVYNGWGSPLLLPQMVVGAIIIRVFGFSYAALSVLGVASAGIAAFLMYRLARVCGAAPFHATLATLILTLNPIYLSVAPSFMNDIPSLALYLGALLALVTALGPAAEDGVNGNKVAIQNHGRFALSIALGVLAGANRQILWAAYLAALLVIAIYAARRSRLPALAAGALVLAIAGALTLWLGKQQYTVPAGISEGLNVVLLAPNVAFMFTYKFLNMMGLFLFPVVLGALWSRRRSLRLLLLSALLLVCLLPLFYQFRTRETELLSDRYYLTIYGQYLTSSGVMVGGPHAFIQRPKVFPEPVIAALVIMGALGLALSAYLFLAWWEQPSPPPDEKNNNAPPLRSDAVARVGASAVALGSAAQVLVSLPWYSSLNVFDRYLLLLLPGFLILHAAQASRPSPSVAKQGREAAADSPRALPLVSGGLAALMALTGILFAGEYVQYTRARAILHHRLREKNIPRDRIDGGVELNADTQIRVKGYVNNPAMSSKEAFRPDARGRLISYRPEMFPEIAAEYILSIDPAPDPTLLHPEPVNQITYFSPLPPTRRTMYVYRLREDAVLPE